MAGTQMTRWKNKLIAFFILIAAYFGKQTYDRNVGAQTNERKRKEEDQKSAGKVADAARGARARAASDTRLPVERVRALGGLRDSDADRK